jgi:hypothetical protein
MKTVNRSKKIENRKKSNIFGCIWMFFCENHRFGWDFELIFQNRSKPNKTAYIYFFLKRQIFIKSELSTRCARSLKTNTNIGVVINLHKTRSIQEQIQKQKAYKNQYKQKSNGSILQSKNSSLPQQ